MPASIPPKNQGLGLGLHHIAFYRGTVVHGLDVRVTAERYLPLRNDVRLAKAELKRIHTQIVMTARRSGRHQFANLFERGVPELPGVSAPMLDEFAAQFPEGFYSETELIELFEEQYPQAKALASQAARRASIARRMLSALTWIESLAAKAPKPDDPVEGWLLPPTAARLRNAGLWTIGDLTEHIRTFGRRWYAALPGMGKTKAQTLEMWLSANLPGFKTEIADRLLVPPDVAREAARTAARKVVVPTSDAAIVVGQQPRNPITPLELAGLSPTLSGADGINRPVERRGGMSASNDFEAIRRWLMTHLTIAESKDLKLAERNHTFRSYRREVERLLNWCHHERGIALSSLDDEDALAFAQWMGDPQPRERWIGPRRPRWHPDWRPYTAPPSPTSQHYTLVVIDALFSYLVDQGYLLRNPWATLPRSDHRARQQFRQRSLPAEAIGWIFAHLDALPFSQSTARDRVLVGLLFGAGVRRAELASAYVRDLQLKTLPSGRNVWDLSVVGKGNKLRDVPVSAALVADIEVYLKLRGYESIHAARRSNAPLLAHLRDDSNELQHVEQPLTADRLYQLLTTLMRAVAAGLGPDEHDARDRLSRASPHWLRHTFATQALHEGAQVRHVQAILGHASVATTGIYIDVDESDRHDVAAKLERLRSA